MSLTEDQKQQVIRWIAEGNKLADVQRRLADEFDVRLTYMEARLLIDDLRLTPLDPPEPVKSPITAETPAPAGKPTSAVLASPDSPAAGTSGVVLKVDEITKPGTIVSGSVTFSDGGKAAWYLDQMGRLGMNPESPGYRPPEPDIQEFQIALDKELTRLGI